MGVPWADQQLSWRRVPWATQLDVPWAIIRTFPQLWFVMEVPWAKRSQPQQRPVDFYVLALFAVVPLAPHKDLPWGSQTVLKLLALLRGQALHGLFWPLPAASSAFLLACSPGLSVTPLLMLIRLWPGRRRQEQELRLHGLHLLARSPGLGAIRSLVLISL